MMNSSQIAQEINEKWSEAVVAEQKTADGIATLWISPQRAHDVLNYLKNLIDKPYRMLYDLTAIDESMRTKRNGQPQGDYTVIYQLFSFDRNEYIRLKVPTIGEQAALGTVTDIWPCANWYEREVWDMFGISFDGHPHLKRILMPPWWTGHPLRKDHPARATDMEPFKLPEQDHIRDEEQLKFHPEEWGLKRRDEDTDFMFLNLGPHHPGTHGVLRLVLQLDGEEILDVVPDIGYHHRGAEKMGERQSWHTYIPYTDRIDYLAGVLNNLPYVLAAEKLAGIEVPDRAKVIRVMLCELFRIASHLVWYGTFAQDLGAMSPVFFMFNDRERIFTIIEAICGFRMHPGWFRIGGVAQDLPSGWQKLVNEFLDYMPPRIKEYDKMIMQNRIFKIRTKGISPCSIEKAIEWGVTGPNLRACGLKWDFRKKMPYSGYEQFDFEIPTASSGDCYDRAVVRVEEIRQSLRIIRQCVDNMPEGRYKADHPVATPPLKEYTMQDIETLITHFLNVSWGPVMPVGEVFFGIEGAKGNNGYYLVSDGGTISYRTRIRTPSFPHMQWIPELARGLTVADLIAILGSIDFVLGDVDR
jgi:NADH-quinone oxidoreductase subunit C/D